MLEVAHFEAGNYRYIRGPFQYSGGVRADPGYTLRRVRFSKPVEVAEGFKLIESHLRDAGRPSTAFAACELRSPAPFDDQGFIDFNRIYVGTLTDWGIFADEENPVARSNVCPELTAPPVPSFHAFTYTVPVSVGRADAPEFVIAGSGEAEESPAPYSERTVRLGDTTADGLREKGRFVLGAMERRMQALDLRWSDVNITQVYTVYDLYPFFADEIVRRGAASGGLTWYYARPPVDTLDYEMDVRSVNEEVIVHV